MKGLDAKQWQLGHIVKLRTVGMEDVIYYKTNKQAVDILFEYNKFTKEYNNYIESSYPMNQMSH